MVHQIFQLCVMQITIYQSVMSLTVIDFYIPEIQTARRYMYGVIPDLEISVQHINFSIHFGPHFTFQIQMLEIAI